MSPLKLTCLLGALLLALICAGLFFTWALFYYPDGPTAETGQARAETLLAALAAYRAQTGAYPPDLETLIPDHLPALPRPSWRAAYLYQVCPANSAFTLSFDLGRSMDGDTCTYLGDLPPAQHNWQCRDSAGPSAPTCPAP